jgi:UDP-N-acetylmuramate dehydrogenase
VAQTIAQVRTCDRRKQTVRTFITGDCAFTYRHSQFKGTIATSCSTCSSSSSGRPLPSHPYAALAEGLDVELGGRVPLADAREAVLSSGAAGHGA